MATIMKIPRKCSFYALIILVLIAFYHVEAKPGAHVRLCGDKLVKMVTGLCKGCVTGSRLDSVSKRAQWPSVDLDEAVDQDENGLLDNGQAVQYYFKRSAARRTGIATECCERTCSYTYLKSFCCKPKTTPTPDSDGD